MNGSAGNSMPDSGEPKVELLFATPIITCRLGKAEQVNAQLEPLILRRMEKEHSVQASNVGGWHSDHQFMRWGGKSAKLLASTVTDIVAARTRSLLARDPRLAKWTIRAWANVSGNGAYNMPHAHGRSYWSVIYYVRVDEGAGGQLVLHDPRLPQTEMHAPHYRFRDAGAEGLYQIDPEAGLLVVMPSWLTHSVRPFQSEGLRISVAMNLSVPD